MISSIIRGYESIFGHSSTIPIDLTSRVISTSYDLSGIAGNGSIIALSTLNSEGIVSIDLTKALGDFSAADLVLRLNGRATAPYLGHNINMRYFNGQFMVAGPSSITNGVVYSDNGINWLRKTSIGSVSLNYGDGGNILAKGNTYVKLVNGNGVGYVNTNTSGNATGDWVKTLQIANGDLSLIGDTFIIKTASNLYTSLDGISWEPHDLNASALTVKGQRSIYFINGKYIILGENFVYTYETFEDILINNYTSKYLTNIMYSYGTIIENQLGNYLLIMLKGSLIISFDGITFKEFSNPNFVSGSHYYQLQDNLFVIDPTTSQPKLARYSLPDFSIYR